MKSRDESIDALRTGKFDVVVIGGGITGSGIALDATTRGLRVALIEKHDFASGTSSRSSKVIHGGLRYMRQLQFGMTIEAVRERETLLRMAPHLVKPLPILLPYRRSAAYTLALTIYDTLGGTPHTGADPHRFAPFLRSDGVGGAFQYFDATADDCRLVMHVLKTATTLGAEAANYCEAVSFTREGVEVRDSLNGEEFLVRGSITVNATGVWSDGVRRRLDKVSPPQLVVSKGIHLVLRADRLRLDGAVVIPKTSAGHYLFISPWQGHTLIGTTDTLYDGSLDQPRATHDDIATLLHAVNEWFPAAQIGTSDIVAVYAGLRPLHMSAAKTSKMSREDFVERRGDFITVAGGKLTTFRRMAKRVVDMISNEPCRTDKLTLFASNALPSHLPADVAHHLHEAFGSEADGIGSSDRVSEDRPHTWAEIDFVIRDEMAMTVADVLTRRTRLALIDRDRGLQHAPAVADRLATHHGWSSAQRDAAITAYARDVEQYSQ